MVVEACFEVRTFTVCKSRYNHNNLVVKPADHRGKEVANEYKTKLKKLASEVGLCLGNFKAYGSRQKLREYLRRHNAIIPRQDAKAFEHAKLFLVTL